MSRIKIAGIVLTVISAAAFTVFLAIVFSLAFVVDYSPDSRLLDQVGCCLGVFGFVGLIVGLILTYIKEATLARIKRRHTRWTFMAVSGVIMTTGCVLFLTDVVRQGGGSALTTSAMTGLFLSIAGCLIFVGCMLFLASYVSGEKVEVSGWKDEGIWRGTVDHTTHHYIFVDRGDGNVVAVPPHCVAPVK